MVGSGGRTGWGMSKWRIIDNEANEKLVIVANMCQNEHDRGSDARRPGIGETDSYRMNPQVDQSDMVRR